MIGTPLDILRQIKATKDFPALELDMMLIDDADEVVEVPELREIMAKVSKQTY